VSLNDFTKFPQQQRQQQRCVKWSEAVKILGVVDVDERLENEGIE
jgi:hypothetical protein